MKAAILSIGTELMDGQIVNKNAAWISKNLKSIGLTTSAHLVVPDERNLMREGLEFCSEKCDLLFVTGGLGPTSDDFTRDIVSEWTERPLKFDEASWLQITERLTSRGFAVKEIQRQQCFYPEGARILNNTEGTANAFFMEVQGKKVFVLPGPPREIEAVWNKWINPWLQENTKKLDAYITHTWDTIGVGESDVALLVEEVLKKSKKKKFEIGYRVHMPYVEVKFSHFKSDTDKVKETIEKINEALLFCTITRDGEEPPDILAKKLETASHVYVEDTVTGSFLINRLLPGLRKVLNEKDWKFSNSFETGENSNSS
ncbi:MAG: competence/damage-inducible protein A, partial [Bdellovibrio sp.]